jgi:hypothetical protein
MKDPVECANKFYLQMSRTILSEKEYDLLYKLLIDKIPPAQAAAQFAVTEQYIEELYQRTLSKAEEITKLFSEISLYRKKLQELKLELNLNPTPAQIRKDKAAKDRQKLLSESRFPISRRLQSVLEALEIKTIGELADIPLKDYLHLRGFKIKCKHELTAFIEFEDIAYLFKGFSRWKKEPIAELK